MDKPKAEEEAEISTRTNENPADSPDMDKAETGEGEVNKPEAGAACPHCDGDVEMVQERQKDTEEMPFRLHCLEKLCDAWLPIGPSRDEALEHGK